MINRLCAVGLLGVLGLAACASPATLAERAEPPAAIVPADGLAVSGALPRTGPMSRADLEALGVVDGKWVHHEKERTFRGVPLDAVLTHCGLDRGSTAPEIAPKDRAPGWKKVVIATAADGFQAVFTCAELMPQMGATRAFVVWELDGAPLPARKGPLQLVVTTDQEGSRSPFTLRSIQIVDAPGTAAGSPDSR